MEWFYSLFVEHSALQAVVVISLVSAFGLMLGKIPIKGLTLGVTFVFFVGILAGHLGLSVDSEILSYVETLGLLLFVYTLGLQVGPGFFSSFRKEGLSLNILAVGVVFLGTILTWIFHKTVHISLPNMVGILCGATTNTPALGAAQQTLKQMNLDDSEPALTCAVAYPLGVLGVILAIIVVRRLFIDGKELPIVPKEEINKTHVVAFRVENPGIFGKSILDIAKMNFPKFVISHIWRDQQVFIPTSEMELQKGDKLLVTTTEKNVPALTGLFGKHEEKTWSSKDLDNNQVDKQLISQRIIITRPEINGRKLGSLRLRNIYKTNISHIYRSGVLLLATPELRLQMGDRLTVVGEVSALQAVEKILGNAVKSLKEPNLVVIFLGMVLALGLGAIPIAIPGIEAPIRLGLAGGAIIVGILIGTFGPRFHMVTYTTRSANLMLRSLGISMYLACLGLDAGKDFFDTVFQPEGLLWIALGFTITFVPIFIMAIIGLKLMKIDYASISGMICGSMSNPMALNYVNDTIASDDPSVSYATVYPLTMFLRVIIAQVILMFFL